MANRSDLKNWVMDALKEAAGEANIIEVARYIWTHHEGELKRSGDLFYTWQYDMRWAATALRREGLMTEGWKLKKS